MKKITYFFIFIISFTTFAQQGISYKALLKDDLGNNIPNTNVVVRFTIYEGDELTNDVYVEQHAYTTDQNGFIILNIGTGNTVDNFDGINWNDDEHFLNVQVNIDGGGLIDLGTTQFMAVPYAKQANKVVKMPEPYILGRSNQSSNGRFQFNGKYGWQAAQEMCLATFPNDPNVRAFTLEQIGQAIVLGNWDTNNLSNIENFFFWGIAPFAVGSTYPNEAHRNNIWGLNHSAGDTSRGIRGKIFIDASTIVGENPNGANPFNTYLEVDSNISAGNVHSCMCGTYK